MVNECYTHSFILHKLYIRIHIYTVCRLADIHTLLLVIDDLQLLRTGKPVEHMMFYEIPLSIHSKNPSFYFRLLANSEVSTIRALLLRFQA